MFVYNKNYLKKLKLQRYYLSKFIYYEASSTLAEELRYSLRLLDSEINLCLNYIKDYEFAKNHYSITIYDLEKGSD